MTSFSKREKYLIDYYIRKDNLPKETNTILTRLNNYNDNSYIPRSLWLAGVPNPNHLTPISRLSGTWDEKGTGPRPSLTGQERHIKENISNKNKISNSSATSGNMENIKSTNNKPNNINNLLSLQIKNIKPSKLNTKPTLTVKGGVSLSIPSLYGIGSGYPNPIPTPAAHAYASNERVAVVGYPSRTRTQPQREGYEGEGNKALRKLFFKYNLISSIGHYISIGFNFININNRINTHDSFDYTGSLLKSNISILLKQFFFSLLTLGSNHLPVLISKPVYIFNHNKVIIQLGYFLDNTLLNKTKNNVLIFIKTLNIILRRANIKDFTVTLQDSGNSKLLLPLQSIGAVSGWAEADATPEGGNKIISILKKIHFYGNPLYKYVLRNYPYPNGSGGFLPRNIPLMNMYGVLGKGRIHLIDKLFYDLYIKTKLSQFIVLLEHMFQCTVQLELTQIYNPSYNSNILSQIIGLNGKENNFYYSKTILLKNVNIYNPKRKKHIKLNFFPLNNNIIPSHLSGVKFRLAGRFYFQKIIPRRTVHTVQLGSLSRGVVNFVESSRFINKSKRGSFSLTVFISHIF
jgi:hypothetical protein